MLGVIDNQLVSLTPILEPVDYALTAQDGKLTLTANGVPIETGVRFHKMTNGKTTEINEVTGEFQISAPTIFRAVFGNNHLELEVQPECIPASA